MLAKSLSKKTKILISISKHAQSKEDNLENICLAVRQEIRKNRKLVPFLYLCPMTSKHDDAPEPLAFFCFLNQCDAIVFFYVGGLGDIEEGTLSEV